MDNDEIIRSEKITIDKIVKEYRVNGKIVLKMLKMSDDSYQTRIFVNGEKFLNCMYILLDIPLRQPEITGSIDSIDEAVEELSHVMELGLPNDEVGQMVYIPPETQFWSHCSNIQAWVENKYDTRILHSNLSFPLLKKLTKAGDLDARSVFKDEIAKRWDSGYYNVMKYLRKNDFLKYLNEEELGVLRFPPMIKIGKCIECGQKLSQILHYEKSLLITKCIKCKIEYRNAKPTNSCSIKYINKEYFDTLNSEEREGLIKKHPEFIDRICGEILQHYNLMGAHVRILLLPIIKELEIAEGYFDDSLYDLVLNRLPEDIAIDLINWMNEKYNMDLFNQKDIDKFKKKLQMKNEVLYF